MARFLVRQVPSLTGGCALKLIRVLLVEDFEPWRRLYRSALRHLAEFQVIGEVSDGLEAVDQARQLQPDLILLDIGLPTLNGIEVARRIREISPSSKILFVSENRSAAIVEEALSTGAGGYVLKSDAAGELLTGVNAVLTGERFVSASLARPLDDLPDPQTGARFHRHKLTTRTRAQNARHDCHHEVGFYSDDRKLLDEVAPFLATALNTGNSAIVIATESHRESLLSRLQVGGLDMGSIIKGGRYVQLDAADTLSMFMVNDMPDPVRFVEMTGDLIMTALAAAKTEHPRISVFGEGTNLLWAQGKADAAIEMEKLASQLTVMHPVEILCGYSLGSDVPRDDAVVRRICAEHSEVYWH